MLDTELAYELLEILQTMKEATVQMKEDYLQGERKRFHELSKDLSDGLIAVQEIARSKTEKDNRIRLTDACTCALESLKDILLLVVQNSNKVVWKLEYELGAIIETAMMQFYYWGIVNEHLENRDKFFEFVRNVDAFCVTRKSVEEESFFCDLSIVVTGYNKLDYTKKCVESILNNVPKNITYELILLNHGSSDGTKEYFESIENIRVINIAVNGSVPGVVCKAFFRGKYGLAVSNDVIVGRNAIANLYRSVLEHPEYGYVVPTTPAVSNLQTIPVDYDSIEAFEEFTEKNNIYDERRHEERVRLCNPIEIMPTTVRARSLLEMYEYIYCSGEVQTFPDDKISLWIRRNGYKCILAKDAYCHHFGSVTLKENLGNKKQQQDFYLNGRKSFLTRYGIDPWGTGVCYDAKLFNDWKFPIIDGATILGINCGLGSNSLKIKEILKENGAQNLVLHNATQEGRYLYDLQGVSDEAFLFWDLRDMADKTGQRKYNYIIVEEEILGNEGHNAFEKVLNAGLQYDQLVWRTPNGEWQIVKK